MALIVPQIIDGGATGIIGSGFRRDDVITACEVTELLRLPVSTVYFLAGRRGDPSVPVGANLAAPPTPDRRGAGLVSELVAVRYSRDDLGRLGRQHLVRGVYV